MKGRLVKHGLAATVFTISLGCGGEAPEPTRTLATVRQQLTAARSGPADINPTDQHVRVWHVTTERSGASSAWFPTGEFGVRSDVMFDAVASPRRAFDDKVLWHEAVSMTFDPQTNTAEKDYHVETSPNLDHGRVDLPRIAAPPLVGADVAPLLAGTQNVAASLFVRDFPRWAPPVRAAAAVVSLDDSAERAAERVRYRENRTELLSVRTQGLRELLERTGATILKTDPVVGSLTVGSA